ncbi:MAG TPA: acyltransferase [Pyrinomonadaceae bacterium]|nr:acyltransferase [Pyrinomonadaceae bacterium]
MTYRDLSALPAAEADFGQFLSQLHDELTKGLRDPNEVVSDTLRQIYFGKLFSPAETDAWPLASRALLHSLDPRNITTEPEYYAEIDATRYQERKPFIWLWQMFDRSPLGQNALLGHRLRRLLAPLIFKSVGANFKCWNYVEWSFGYNLSFGDNVVLHRHVLLDDRGGIEVGSNVSISDYVNVYSHTHDIHEISKVYNLPTRIGNDVRLTYHCTVLAGCQVGDRAMVGTGAVVTKDVAPGHIVVGIPAKTAKVRDRSAAE